VGDQVSCFGPIFAIRFNTGKLIFLSTLILTSTAERPISLYAQSDGTHQAGSFHRHALQRIQMSLTTVQRGAPSSSYPLNMPD